MKDTSKYSAASKKRWAELTPDRRAEIAAKSSASLRLRNASPEAKKRNSEVQKAYWKKQGQEARAAQAQRARDAWSAKTPEQKEEWRRKKQEGILKKTPEAIKTQYEKRAKTLALRYPNGISALVSAGLRSFLSACSPDTLKKRKEANIAGMKNRSPERKAQVSATHKALWKSRTHEQLVALYLQQCKGRANLRKSFISKKMGQSIMCDSSYEQKACALLEQSEQILSYGRCTFGIPYHHNSQMHMYFPDFIAFDCLGQCTMIEVKPESLLENPWVLAKSQAALLFCEARDMRFCIWTETDLGIRV